MRQIKVGRQVFEVKPGDYILDNGACYQFCSGDNRILYRKGFDSYRHIVVSKRVIKEFNNFEGMEKVLSRDLKMAKYIFK